MSAPPANGIEKPAPRREVLEREDADGDVGEREREARLDPLRGDLERRRIAEPVERDQLLELLDERERADEPDLAEDDVDVRLAPGVRRELELLETDLDEARRGQEVDLEVLDPRLDVRAGRRAARVDRRRDLHLRRARDHEQRVGRRIALRYGVPDDPPAERVAGPLGGDPGDVERVRAGDPRQHLVEREDPEQLRPAAGEEVLGVERAQRDLVEGARAPDRTELAREAGDVHARLHQPARAVALVAEGEREGGAGELRDHLAVVHPPEALAAVGLVVLDRRRAVLRRRRSRTPAPAPWPASAPARNRVGRPPAAGAAGSASGSAPRR